MNTAIPLLVIGLIFGGGIGFTIAFALLGSMLVALMAAPVLSLFLLKRGKQKEMSWMRRLRGFYRPLLEKTVRKKRLVVLSAFAGFILSLAAVPFLGSEFIPTLHLRNEFAVASSGCQTNSNSATSSSRCSNAWNNTSSAAGKGVFCLRRRACLMRRFYFKIQCNRRQNTGG